MAAGRQGVVLPGAGRQVDGDRGESRRVDLRDRHAERAFSTGITTSIVDRTNHYVVTRDGQRFLVNLSAEDENSAPITVVSHWRR